VTAVDTNVIVRVVTRDDPEQLEAALTVFRRGPLFAGKTVLLETEWVLRYCYKLDRKAIGGALRKLLGYPALRVEDRDTVLLALVWYGEGLDFADALHLASSQGSARRFATFDRELAGASSGALEGQGLDLELLR
jgi:predicted nucleic-acid-binding protein